MKKNYFKAMFLVFSLIGTSVVCAQDLVYPELQVAPKASERLLIEAQVEQKSRLFYHAPIQASAALTMTAGLLHFSNIDESKDPDKKTPFVGLAVGGAWIGATILLGQQFQAYTRAYNRIKSMPANTQREQLIKERLAEEEIRSIGNLGRKMAWASVFSNFFASGYMFTTADSKENIQSAACVLAMIGSFAPLLFQNPWADVAAEQESYKKKIYGRLSFAPFASDSVGKAIPGMTIGMTF